MATGVLKVRVGGAWQNVGVAAIAAAHHATHEPGGPDVLTKIDAGILTQGALPDARLSVNVLKVTGGFPGGTTNFLRADGTFAAVGTGTVTGPGSSVANNLAVFADATGKVIRDSLVALSNVPRLDAANTFTSSLVAASLQASNYGSASLILQQLDGPVDQRLWQMYCGSGSLVIRALNDAFSVQQGYLALTNGGTMSLSGSIVLPAAQGIWVNAIGPTGNLRYYLDSALCMMRCGPGGALSWQNSGGSVLLSGAEIGTVTVPYYLVIPVGANRWAP